MESIKRVYCLYRVSTTGQVEKDDTLPAFLSPNVAKVLVENFGIAGIGTVEDDMRIFFEN